MFPIPNVPPPQLDDLYAQAESERKRRRMTKAWRRVSPLELFGLSTLLLAILVAVSLKLAGVF